MHNLHSKIGTSAANWDALVLVMIKIVTQTKFVRFVAETGQNCVMEIDGDWFSRCFHICRKQRVCFESHNCMNDESL